MLKPANLIYFSEFDDELNALTETEVMDDGVLGVSVYYLSRLERGEFFEDLGERKNVLLLLGEEADEEDEALIDITLSDDELEALLREQGGMRICYVLDHDDEEEHWSYYPLPTDVALHLIDPEAEFDEEIESA